MKGTGYDLLNFKIPEEDWYIPKVLAKGQHTVFVGDGGCGKSTFLLYLSLCIATGIDSIFGKTKKADVLFIDEEMSAKGLSKKLTKLSKPLGIKDVDLRGLHYRSMEGFKFDVDKVELEYVIEQYKNVRVIMIDSLLATCKGDPNTMDMRKIRDFLRIGFNHDITIVFAHHTNKAGLEKGYVNAKTMFGSIDITNAFDNTYGISKFPGKIKLEQVKSRYLPPEERINVNIQFASMRYSKPFPSKERKYYEGLLGSMGGKFLSHTDLERMLCPDLFSRKTMDKYLKLGLESGLWFQDKEGKYGITPL